VLDPFGSCPIPLQDSGGRYKIFRLLASGSYCMVRGRESGVKNQP
jgi:hypothetical protein